MRPARRTYAGGMVVIRVVGGRARRPVRRAVGAALAAVGLLLAAGCQSTAPSSQAASRAEQKIPQAQITVDPAASAAEVRPDAKVKVTVSKGKLTNVTVTDDKNKPVAGSMSGDAQTWTSTDSLQLAASYSVRASAVDAKGLTTSWASAFSTVKPKADLTTSISPLTGMTVGVGMPIIVRLSAPVTNRAAVQRGLTVDSAKPIEGSWSWMGNQELHFRPKAYWPAYNSVTLHVRLRGVDGGKGVWGAEDRTVAFTTGASMVSIVDVTKHQLSVFRNGKLTRRVPITTGRNGYLTRNGIKVISEKWKMKIMDASTIGISKSSPDYYYLKVPYAMRMTNSGEFVHAAPWSVSSQGRVNVSHGCVGMSMSNAIWLFNQTHIGDIVQVVNSPRRLEPGNGWTDWNVPWATWVQGSAAA